MARTPISGDRVAGQGLLFHGGSTTDSLVASGSSALADEPQKTVACWLNPISTNGGSARIFRRNAFTVRFSSTQITLVQTATGSGTWGISSTRYPALGTWFHLAITYDRSGGSPLAAVPIIYVNGVAAIQIAPVQPTGTITADGVTNWCIGNVNSGGTQPVDGTMANIYIYERILSAAEVLSLYNNVDPSSANLVCKYRLTTGLGAVAVDESSHNYKGIIVGASWVPTTLPLQRVAAGARTSASARTPA